MKIKIDENLGRRAAELLRVAGHDATTVPEENLCSSSDRDLIHVCREERRCLVTLDLDFGNPFLFPPAEFHGIAVLRVPPKPSPTDLDVLLRTLIGALERDSIKGKLWIVQPGRIREHQEP